MSKPTVVIDGKEYELSTKLRVAYKVQGQNGHKPYSEVFASIDKMPLENQIDILYTAFEVANPDQANFITRQDFLNHYLDNEDLDTVMSHLQGIVEGILGKPLADETTTENNTESGEQKN